MGRPLSGRGRRRSVRSVLAPSSVSAAHRGRGRAARSGPQRRPASGSGLARSRGGVPARTVSAILRRHGVPYLRECDPLTGEVIRSSKATAVRYEHDHPGSLGHMDVKKLGKIPDQGGWRARGRAATSSERDRRQRRGRIGFDYVHSLVDDHSRLAYSEILPDEKGATCAEFLERAITYFAAHGIARIERLMTDNAFAYRHSLALREVCAAHHIQQIFIRPHCPLAERQGRKIQPHHPDRMGLPPDLPQQHRAHRSPGALAGALQHWSTPLSPWRQTPDQPTDMNLSAEYI